MVRPDETLLNDPAMELLLPETAELNEIAPALLAQGKLPGLWSTNEITAKSVVDYFSGSKTVKVERDGYQEQMHIPKADRPAVESAIETAVEAGILWMLSGPASIFGEPVPPGVLTSNTRLCAPPEVITAPEILPENLPDAWTKGVSSGLSIATALSTKVGKNLPWKTVRDVLNAALQARFLRIIEGTEHWPCGFPSAEIVKFKVSKDSGTTSPPGVYENIRSVLMADTELEPSQIQDLADAIPKLLKIKTKKNVPIRFRISIEMGDGKAVPPSEVTEEVNKVLKDVKDDLQLK